MPASSGTPAPSTATPSLGPTGAPPSPSGGGQAGGPGPNGSDPSTAPVDPGPANRPGAERRFVVGRDGLGQGVSIGAIEISGVGSLIDWAVPALVLSVPGLLVLLAILAQTAVGALWLPVARRWLGAFGLRRKRRQERPAPD